MLSGSAQKSKSHYVCLEYKVISSGKADSPRRRLLEKFLGELGRDEWEIINYQSAADNPLAFAGLARRPTQRDWTLEDAVATAAKAEAEKLRAEFAAKFEAATRTAPAATEEKAAASFLGRSCARRRLPQTLDTSHDDDPMRPTNEGRVGQAHRAEEDELPTFFRRDQTAPPPQSAGPRHEVGVDYLAKNGTSPRTTSGRARECGFAMPRTRIAGGLPRIRRRSFLAQHHRRGELWIKRRKKPRAVSAP